MIEFTLSRVCLCICCISMLAAVVGTMSLIEDDRTSDADTELVTDISRMLDSIAGSGLSSVTIEGDKVLPTSDHSLSVRGGVVELRHSGDSYYAVTVLELDFELTYGSSVTLGLSIPEGLGDVADGVGEDVDLLGTVVQVDGRPGATVDAA